MCMWASASLNSCGTESDLHNSFICADHPFCTLVVFHYMFSTFRHWVSSPFIYLLSLESCDHSSLTIIRLLSITLLIALPCYIVWYSWPIWIFHKEEAMCTLTFRIPPPFTTCAYLIVSIPLFPNLSTKRSTYALDDVHGILTSIENSQLNREP